MKLKRKFWWVLPYQLKHNPEAFFSRHPIQSTQVRVEVRLAPKRRKKKC
jgi:hypothetical protein